MTTPKDRKLGSGWTASILVILVLGLIAVGWIAPKGWNLVLASILMVLFNVVLGLHSTGRALGILINERKLVSLSRFQIVLWTVIILSAYFVIVMERIRASTADPSITDPLAIEMDWRLWALMGISTTSLVGTPLIQSVKKRKNPEKDVLNEPAYAFDEKPEDVDKNREGLLYGNANISDARFADLFEGDELKNTQFIDMSKVQMFFFTVIAAVSYMVLLFQLIVTRDPKNLTIFPVLPEGLIAILGISHAGYLGSKAVDHTKTGSPQTTKPP